MILAPLRGVTTRCFRETFANEIAEAGFTEAVTPFITATLGFDPLKDRELGMTKSAAAARQPAPRVAIPATPQFIGKDPGVLRTALERVKAAGIATADLNCGCPFPMVRNKGRGSGLLRTPDVLREMLEAGCSVLGEGAFSVKARLGVDSPDELLALLPVINCFPLKRLTVHARTARQMYEGECDMAAFARVVAASANPVVYNGDAAPDATRRVCGASDVMVGRAFVRLLGEREDSGELLKRYVAASIEELKCEHAVIGRMKELVSYWKDLPRWRRLWPTIKISRTIGELMTICE